MKLSISLSDQDVAVLDAYIERAGLPSRSAGLQRAVRMLRHPNLEEDYAEAWEEWAADDEESWSTATADGLDHAAR